MKKLILSAILFLGLTTAGFSQQHSNVQKSPEERAQRMTDMLDKKLSLTDNQKTQIYQINLERAQSMKDFKRTDKTADRSQMKAKFEASESRILGVLNENQRGIYNQWNAEREEKFKHHQGNRQKGFKSKKA